MEVQIADGRWLQINERRTKDGGFVSVAGVVLVRQRPGSAKGVVFLTLEDEFSVCNVVIWPQVLEAHRSIVMGARLMLIRGRVQKSNDVLHVVADKVEDKTAWLNLLLEDSQPKSPAPTARHPRHSGCFRCRWQRWFAGSIL